MFYFDKPQAGRPLSLLSTIMCSAIPLGMLFVAQPFFVFGIMGLPNTWMDVINLDLDLDGLLQSGRLFSAFGTVLAFVRPTIPGEAPKWLRQLFPVIAWLFFSDEATIHTGEGRAQEGQGVSEADFSAERPPDSEMWMYVNGICTTKRMALETGDELADLVHRDISVVHNTTDSAIVDLAECIFAKLWIGQNWVTSVPTRLGLGLLLDALQDKKKEKVVMVAHSQGTIIASDILWHLWDAVDHGKLPEECMKKLEMYNLANAGHWMSQRDGVPYIENICNQRDNVGMLGANAPTSVKDLWNLDVQGKLIYPAKTRWGHMINAHYLKYLKQGDYAASKLHYYISQEPPEERPKRRAVAAMAAVSNGRPTVSKAKVNGKKVS